MAENKTAPYSFVKDGVYYFSRRIPKDLQHHYTSQKISYSLRTRSAAVASSRAIRAAQKLDEYWYHLRVKDSDLPGKHLLRMAQNANSAAGANVLAVPSTETLKLSEAVAVYLRLKGQGRPVTFHRAAERSCGYVIDGMRRQGYHRIHESGCQCFPRRSYQTWPCRQQHHESLRYRSFSGQLRSQRDRHRPH